MSVFLGKSLTSLKCIPQGPIGPEHQHRQRGCQHRQRGCRSSFPSYLDETATDGLPENNVINLDSNQSKNNRNTSDIKGQNETCFLSLDGVSSQLFKFDDFKFFDRHLLITRKIQSNR